MTKFSAGPGRKVKRVSDVNAMGAPAPSANPYMENPFDAQQPSQPPQYGAGPHIDPIYMNTPAQPQYNPNVQQQQQQYNPNVQQQQQYGGFVDFNQPQKQQQQPSHINNGPQIGAPFGVFQQPIVQDMAMQYGQKLADQGKQIVESHFEKYVPITRLKYYFAVDNNYVINKLRLLFFPFTHSVSFFTTFQKLLHV